MSIFSRLLQTDSSNSIVKVLPSDEFKARLTNNENALLIDVRTPSEFNSGHIKGAKNMDMRSTKFLNAFDGLKKSKPLYLYCRSGVRSRQASKQLAKIGFTEIYDLKGGYLNW